MTDEAAYLVSRRFEQATKTLDAAVQLLHSGHLRDAINRAYYSMFYAGLALLATRMLGAGGDRLWMPRFSVAPWRGGL